jgi:hypothetical protein
VETSQTVTAIPVEVRSDFLHWTPIIAGALVASALFIILITFGSAIGLSVASTSPTWRDTSSTFVLLSGLFLLLTALVSFGFGGYIAGRLRRTWNPAAHNDWVEFRDGAHGLTSWALGVVIGALIATAVAAAVSSRTAPTTAAPAETSVGENLIAYDLDRLFRSDRRSAGDLAYSRAEASRILLAATSREGVRPDDRAYLGRLIARETAIAPPEAERRADEAVAATATAVKKARQSGVIFGFSFAAALLLGAAAAWYAARLGGEHRDQAEGTPLRWRLERI